MIGLRTLRGDVSPLNQISTFERRVNHCSAMRGWASCMMQSQDETTTTLDVELVAKNTHIGWARSIVTEWDAAYGPQPMGAIKMNGEGLMDSDNFATASGYRLYRGRTVLAMQRYMMPREVADPCVIVLSESQKHIYRASAEILLNAYLSRNQGVAYTRTIVRVDHFVPTELNQLGIIRAPPKREVTALSTFQKTILFGSNFGRGSSLTGRGSSRVTPMIAMPVPVPVPVPAPVQSIDNVPEQNTTVTLTLPLGINFNIVDGHVVVIDVLDVGSAFESGDVQNGMRVITINDNLVYGMTVPEVVQIIQNSGGDDMYVAPNASFAGMQCKLELQSDPAHYQDNTPNMDTEETAELTGFEPIRQQAPVWFHGELDKATAAAVLKKETQGVFLVRQRVKKEEFALALTLGGGKVRHHLIRNTNNGKLSIDGVDVGDVTKLTMLIDRLRLKRDNWPQQLLGFIARPGCSLSDVKKELAHVARVRAREERIFRIERWEIDRRGTLAQQAEEGLAREKQEEEDRIAQEATEIAEREQMRIAFEESRLAQVHVDAQERRTRERTRGTSFRRMSDEFTRAAEIKATAIIEKRAPKPRKVTEEDVGRRCTVKGQTCRGTIRFYGQVDGKVKVGVELDYPTGNHRGTVKGHEYFTCAKKHGIIVLQSKVRVVGEKDSESIVEDVNWDEATLYDSNNRASIYSGGVGSGDADVYGALRGFNHSDALPDDETSSHPVVQRIPNVLYDAGDSDSDSDGDVEYDQIEPVGATCV